MAQTTQDEDYGYGSFPERDLKKKKTVQGATLFNFHSRCQVMLQFAMETSPYAKLLLSALKNSGCQVLKGRHLSCEECDKKVSGGFDAEASQIVLCQNNIHNQAHMNQVLTHELVHAFDHCRAKVDWFNNYRHLACSEIRAANLSGECAFKNQMFKFQVKKHHQECVRAHALQSMLNVRKITRKDAEEIVDEVFDSCFNDHEPFGRIPHGKKDARFAYRDYMNRDRYYSNI